MKLMCMISILAVTATADKWQERYNAAREYYTDKFTEEELKELSEVKLTPEQEKRSKHTEAACGVCYER